MTNIKVTRCKGECQGSCTRCTKNGKWNRNWMCFLYKIEGMDGCYCSDCMRELLGAKTDAEGEENEQIH